MRSRLLSVVVATAVALGGAATLAAPAHAVTGVDITLPSAPGHALYGTDQGVLGTYVESIAPMHFTAQTSGSLTSVTADIGYDATPGFTSTVYADDQVSFGAAAGLTQLDRDLYVGTPLGVATAGSGGPGHVSATFASAPHLEQGTDYWVITVGAGNQPIWINAWSSTDPAGYRPNGGTWTQAGYAFSLDLDVAATPVAVALSPASPNGDNGWYTSDVTATYTCTNEADTCPSPRTLDTDGELTPSGSTPLNSGATTFDWFHTLKRDATGPTVTGTATHLAPAHAHASLPTTGFVVHWTCTDATSGVASCPADTYVTGLPGHTTAASGVATDEAGNESTGTVTGLVEGVHAPTITIHGVTPNKTYKYGTVLTPTCTAVATLQVPVVRAGIAPAPTCTGTTAKKTAKNGSVTWTYTATATDSRIGGGTTTKAASWTVAASTAKATATITITGFPKKTKNGWPVIDHRKDYKVTVVIRDAHGKVLKGKPTWLRSVMTNKTGTKGKPTKKSNQFHKVHGKWVMTFTPGYSYAGEYRKFGVLASNGKRFYSVIYVK